MKSKKLALLGMALSLGAVTPLAFAGYFYDEEVDNSVYGNVYSVPAGAAVESEAYGGTDGFAESQVSGGGVSADDQAFGPNQDEVEVNYTSYGDTLSYHLFADNDAWARLVVTW